MRNVLALSLASMFLVSCVGKLFAEKPYIAPWEIPDGPLDSPETIAYKMMLKKKADEGMYKPGQKVYIMNPRVVVYNENPEASTYAPKIRVMEGGEVEVIYCVGSYARVRYPDKRSGFVLLKEIDSSRIRSSALPPSSTDGGSGGVQPGAAVTAPYVPAAAVPSGTVGDGLLPLPAGAVGALPPSSMGDTTATKTNLPAFIPTTKTTLPVNNPAAAGTTPVPKKPAKIPGGAVIALPDSSLDR